MPDYRGQGCYQSPRTVNERKNKMKNKLLIVVIAILCLIPGVVAVVNYKNSKDAPVDMSTAVKVVLDDINGRSYTFNKNSDDPKESEQAEALIGFFMTLNKNASQITALPDSLLGEKFYKVTFSNGTNDTRSESYEYYFSSDPTTCYYRAQSGNTFKIAEEDAKIFLGTTYAESVYADSTMPVLRVAQTEIATPDSAIWQYRNYSGEYVDADTSAMVDNTVETHELAGGLDLEFDIEPDYCLVSVTDDAGENVWEGLIGELRSITLDKTKPVVVTVKAKWYEDSSRSFCGELDYVFSTVLTAPATFHLALNKVNSGAFVAVTATNVLKPEAVEVTSDLPTTIAPVFYKAEDNMAVGIMPIDIDTPSGTYTLTFKYGGMTEDIALTVDYFGVRASGYIVPEAVVNATRSAAALNEFKTVADELMATGSEERYFSGYFLEGIDGWNHLTRGFGRDVYLNNSTEITYRNNGVDYSAAAGVDVVAANNGVVVFADILDYSGYTVVIEHGYGLKTWYYNLGDTTVSKGDVVQRGDKIGETGQTGFCAEAGAHIAMSVGSKFVCPYDTWEDGDVAKKVAIAKIDEVGA